MMERLTDQDTYCAYIDCGIGYENCRMTKQCYDKKLYDKLKAYEELEEQGMLLRLPRRVGDVVYRINPYAKAHTSPMRVSKVVYAKSYSGYSNIEIHAIDMEDSGHYAFYEREINKGVFLTKEEAEAALAEMG